jgi:EAL domain-containing protein (putative c-di-GMP-specific phosphodiesterase class I)/CheY-like chemotaxis protein
MGNHQIAEASKPVLFGHRKIRPRACLADGKQHIRTFLADALEELGFITCECAQIDELPAILETQPPDLFVLGLSAGGVEGATMLTILAAHAYDGKVLLLGPRNWPMVAAVRERGEELGLAMLPSLATPFANGNLHDSVASLLPADEPPTPPVDVAQAVNAGWLELWYQPKLDAHTLNVASAEALIRMRHPAWGVVPPAYFVPDDGDPHFRALSEFVIGQAIHDWHDFLGQHGPIEIAINLPIGFLQDPDSLRTLCGQMPKHPAFAGLIVETNGPDVLRNLAMMKNVAGKVRFHNIGLSIDLGEEWLSFADIGIFPFVEIKVDRKFVAGCAENALKQMVCRQILDLADTVGARTVAEGVETRADFECVREMGFGMVQGSLFAKPMPARKFTRTVLSRPLAMPH